MGQVAYFLGYDGETHAGFAGSGGFYGGVEGEEVGLEGDFVDGFEDACDVIAGVFNGVHGCGHCVHVLGTLISGLAG